MKKAFLGLLLVVAWLGSFPAYATTYTYDVDYSFGLIPADGEITGFITTSCDNCILTASNVLSWSFTASDGTSDSSSNPGSGINASGNILQATPTGIYTVTNATLGGFFAFCSAIANNGSDCFSTAGLNVNDVKPDQAAAIWHIAWEEDLLSGRDVLDKRPRRTDISFYRDCFACRPRTVSLGDDDHRLCRFGLRRPSAQRRVAHVHAA